MVVNVEKLCMYITWNSRISETLVKKTSLFFSDTLH